MLTQAATSVWINRQIRIIRCDSQIEPSVFNKKAIRRCIVVRRLSREYLEVCFISNARQDILGVVRLTVGLDFMARRWDDRKVALV